MPHVVLFIAVVIAVSTPSNIEYSLALGSNPEFTAVVLVAYARAVHLLGTV